jgi:nitric oxide reductase subunit B
MAGTFHTLEWVRMIGDMMFLLLGAVPIVLAAFKLICGKEAKAR